MRFIRIICTIAFVGALSGQNGQPMRALTRDVAEEYHGTKISDPYRWMEDMNGAEFKSWLKSQADFTRTTIDRIPGRDRLAARLNELSTAVAQIALPVRRGNRYFYFKRLPNEDVRKLYVREGLRGTERLLVDPTKKATATVHYSIDYYEPSPDGSYVAYGASPGGSENSVLSVLETATGRDLGEAIDRTQYASPQWRPDGRSFFYWREQKRAANSAPETRYLNSRNFLHVLGRNPDDDPAVLGRGLNSGVDVAESDFPIVAVPFGSQYALGILAHGVQPEITLYVAPLESVRGPDTPWRKVADVADAVTGADMFGDNIYALTHRDALRFKLVRTSASRPDLAHAAVVVPESEAVLTSLVIAKDGVYVQTLDGGVGRLLRIAHGGTAKAERIALPSDGAISYLWSDARAPGAMTMLTSWTTPPLLYEYEPAGRKLTDTGLQPPHPVDMSGYESEEVKAKSYDGTLVPLSIVHRKGMPLDGSHPALLEGYGSYGITEDPSFLAMKLPWLEHGGVYAVAHVRGGGEYGEGWHAGGKMQTKPNTFRDGIACAQYLIEHGYTSARKLSVTGTSAGGIFAGGAVTERPDLFGAALIRVGVSDMLRMETTEGGPANIMEFGTVRTPEGFKGLLAMSPYHRVKDGVAYPAVLLTTGTNDPRVTSWEPAKMAARLQAASSSGKPVLLRVDYDAGHGLGSTRTQNVQEWADDFAFLLWQLGERDFQPK
jgi:prolyl oligopeptidase